MKNLTRFSAVVIIFLLLGSGSLWAGQNSGAGIRIDLNWTQSGNQIQNSLSPAPSVGNPVRVDIYITGASNLDTYEFDLNYDSDKLTYNSATSNNPWTLEKNIL